MRRDHILTKWNTIYPLYHALKYLCIFYVCHSIQDDSMTLVGTKHSCLCGLLSHKNIFFKKRTTVRDMEIYFMTAMVQKQTQIWLDSLLYIHYSNICFPLILQESKIKSFVNSKYIIVSPQHHAHCSQWTARH